MSTGTDDAARPGGAPAASPWETTMDSRRAGAGFFDQNWARIIDTQPPGIRSHLAAERALVDAILVAQAQSGRAYRTVVEAGCANGTLLLPVIRRHGLRYIGVDIAPDAVEATRAALAADGDGDGPPPGQDQAVRADIRDLAALVADGTVKPTPPLLVAFPFNVFGNIPRPRPALVAALDAGGDALVLTYETSAKATELRAEYYRECGFHGEFREDENGVHFTADLFTSDVYHPDVVSGWLRELGYAVTVRAYGEVGLAYHGRMLR